jgi:outer membrane protein TolC
MTDFRGRITAAGILIFVCAGLYAEEPLTWSECVKEAAGNHPDLISAKEVVKQSEAGRDITRSAIFPQVDAEIGASTAKTAGSAGNRDTYSYGLSGTQLLFDGTKTANSVRAAAENIAASRAAYRFASADVRRRLRIAFINLLKMQELIGLTDEIYKIRETDMDLIRLRYESGMEHKGALLTAQANLEQALFEIVQAKRNQDAARRQLLKEMGARQYFPVKVKGNFAVQDSESDKPDFEALARKHPSFLNVVAKTNQAAFNRNAAYGRFFPSVSAQGGTGMSGSTLPVRDEEWSVGVAASLPIFEGGLRHAQVSQAQAVLAQAQADQRSTQDALTLALEQTWAALQDAMALVSIQQKFLAAVEERAKIAEAQYSTGFISYDNWTIIRDRLVSAKKSFLDAQASVLLAEANWVNAKGEILEYAE